MHSAPLSSVFPDAIGCVANFQRTTLTEITLSCLAPLDPNYHLISCCGFLRLGARRKPTPATMGLSKTNRIIILLAIDTSFFFMELITGMVYLPPSGATMSFADLDVP
jgi:hypothetical protein